MSKDVYLDAWQASPLAILTVDALGQIRSVNPAGARFFSRSAEELIGAQLVELTHRLDRGALQFMLDEAKARRTPGRQEVRFASPAGAEAIAGFSIAPVAGRVGTSICVLRDLAQEKAFRPQLLHTERMASMGMIASVVAHELNNALAGAMGCLELITDDADSDSRQLVGTAKVELERAADLVRDLKEYARVEDGMSDRIDIAALFNRANRLHRFHANPSGIELQIAAADGLPELRGNTNQLIQALLNLISNAEDAVSTLKLEHPPAICLNATVKDDVVFIDLVDRGPGLSRDQRTVIFEPFYSTKPAGLGTGLGLSVVQAIVTAHEGRVEALETPGGGATFRLVLPWATSTKPMTPSQAPLTNSKVDMTGTRVLIAEDEPAIRRVLQRGLQACSAEVVAVADAQAAIDATRASEFDAILLDVRMPGGGGVAAFREITAQRPDLARKTVFITGELSPEMPQIVGAGYARVISKPFSLPYLIRTLKEVIDEG